jgi:hypothetical protein
VKTETKLTTVELESNEKVFSVHLLSIHPSIYPSLPHGAMCGLLGSFWLTLPKPKKFKADLALPLI